MMKFSFRFLLWSILGICLFTGCTFIQKKVHTGQHFSLSPRDAKQLTIRTSDLKINVKDLNYWDQIVANLVKQAPPKRAGDTFRLYTYLYCAQKAFADASFQITSTYAGSIDPISIEVLRLFYPDYANDELKTDAYSVELTELLMPEVKNRFTREEKNIYAMVLPKKEGLWEGTNPPVELSIPSMEPWVISNPDEFKSPHPPAPKDREWDGQLRETKRYFRRATPAQRQRSFAWQEQTNPEGTNWTANALTYMEQNNIPLEMRLEFRAKFYMAMMDAMISVFNDKFIYMVARPIARDPKFNPLFKTPNHPSYPSAHSSISSAAATILSYYFPENAAEWKRLATEAGVSRLWAGIHFPIDNDAGMEQGNRIAQAVLFR